MIITKCRKGGKAKEKIATVPVGCDISPGDFLILKKVEADVFDDLFEFKEGRKRGRKK